MKINKEHFEVFIDLDGFDSLLEYQNSSVTYGKLFDYNRIIIGDSDNPIRQFEPKYNHLKSKPKIYKCFYNLKTSYYDEFESLPDDYSYPILNENKKTEILISEDSQKFLDFFNKVEKELDSKNFLNYRFEKVISKSHESNQNTHFSEQEFQSNEDTFLKDPTVKETVFENNNTITEVIEKTLNNNNVINQVEKAWEKVIEKTKLEKQQKDKYSFETNISEENNTYNQTSKTVNNKNNNFTDIKNTNNNSSNILNNIEILESNQAVQYITKTVEESIENKFENVITQIHHQNIVNNQTMIESIDKIIKKQNEENRNLQKKTTTNVESTLDKFLRS